MRITRRLCALEPKPLSLLLTYALALSLAAPFFVKRAAATHDRTTFANKSDLRKVPAKNNAQAQNGGWREGELLVRFRRQAPAARLNDLLKKSGAQWGGRLRGQSRVERLRLPAGSNPETVAVTFRSSELVDFAEPNYLITADQDSSQPSPDDPRGAQQWALKNLGASRAWGKTTGSKKTVIAVIDGGIDFNHKDLTDNRWDNPVEQADNLDEDGNEYNDDLHGWDFLSNSPGGADGQGHGTAVAGIIAARGNNAAGVTGLMWRASLMSLRVLDADGTGDAASAVEAVDYAVANGAQVINCSWGTEHNSSALFEALSRASEKGVVVVTSAGNGGRDVDVVTRYPASYELANIIAVASNDTADKLAAFSNWGARHVAVAAPGTEILTTKMGGDYQVISGSSASAPLVAGIAGLVKTLRPWLNAGRTRDTILRGVRPVAGLSEKVASKGIVSAAGALDALETLPPGEGLDESSGNNGGEHGSDVNDRRRRPGARPADHDRGRDDNKFKVTPPARTEGAPGPGLPDLNELRRKQPVNPKAFDPLPSTRCAHNDPDCASDRRKASLEQTEHLLAWGERAPSLGSDSGGSDQTVSDSPFRLFWFRTTSSLPTRPQANRTNYALASNGGVATASSYTPPSEGDFPVNSLINGDRRGINFQQGGGWRDGNDSFPDWVQIELAGNRSIDEIDVFTVQDNYSSPVEPAESQTFSLYGVTAFDVQYWSGNGWANVAGASVTGNNKVWRKFTFPAVNTSKVRVLIHNALYARSRLIEVEAWGAEQPARVNVALASNGATASASSIYPAYSFSPAGAIDGERAGRNYSSGGAWHDYTAGAFPDWLQIDFNGSKTIDEIDVYTLQDNATNDWTNVPEPTAATTFTAYGLRGYEVQYWTGSAWANVPGGGVGSNNLVWRKISFSPVSTQKIRVLTNASADGYSRVVELEAWGTPAAAASSSDPSGDNYSRTRLDAYNRTGDGGVDLLSGNMNWSLPILGLKGRAGLDLGLSLSYNSLVWTKDAATNTIRFDADRGTPSPGFRLGFPVIQPPYYNSQAGRNAFLLITPSGSRVELRQVGATNDYDAYDSSYLRLTDNGGGSLTLRPTDGSQLSYALKNGQYQCVGIKDRNGNFITINHHADGRLKSITDTLARVITFNYDGYLNLTSITQDWGGATHVWASFGWTNINLSTGFSGLSLVGAQNNQTIAALTQVSLDDGTRYTFGYNGYAQVNLIRHYAADNHQLSYTAYTHTLPGGAGDCPRVTETRVWAEYWTGLNNVPAEVSTQYGTAPDHSWGQMTLPDGTVYKELYATTPDWRKGLTTGTQYWAGGVKKKWTETAYTQSNTSLPYQQNPRVTETNVYDSDNNRKRTRIEYGAPGSVNEQWNLPSRVIEYAADGTTEIRHTFTGYNLDPAYVSRRMIGLVSAVHVSDTLSWQSIVYYTYDAGGGQLLATPNPTVQHDDANYGIAAPVRGNLTTVTRYDASDPNNATNRTATQMGYDTNGSVVFTRDPLGHQTNVSFADSYADGNNARNTYAYPTIVSDPEGYSTALQYNFEFGAVTRAQGPPPQGHAAGAVQAFEYDGAGRPSRIRNLVNNAYRQWVYDPAGHVSLKTVVEAGGQETISTTVYDGLGRVRATSADNPNSSGGYTGQYTYYDRMGRVFKLSNPTEITMVTDPWTAAGDDAAAGWAWTEQAYDWKGRPTTTTNPDGTTKEVTYGGCGCAGGEVVTVRDEMGRRARLTSDVLGRPWKTETLNWDLTIYTTAINTYNALDQITSVYEAGGGAGQTTTLTYDGHGRLKTRQTPAQANATTYVYNSDDTVQRVTDARGASATFSYNNRHQPTNISYTSPAGIMASSPVTFGYDAAGNRTSMADGSGRVTYVYDQLSRLTSEARQFADLPGVTRTLSYGYNLANDLTSITDPDGKLINYAYDRAGRVTDVTGTTFAGVTQYAANIRQRAWGGVKSASYGDNSSLNISYNARLLPTDFNISGSISKHYEYFPDGRLRYSRNNGHGALDRSYTYDHAGRVTEAFSGPLARGEADTDYRPYKLTYSYDAFDHLTSRAGRVWSAPTSADTGSGVFVNERNTGWQYDADGRLIDSAETQYGYDATGRLTGVTGDGGALAQAQVYDGDGMRTKLFSRQNTYHEDTGTWTAETKTQYFVVSSVLGKVLTELDENGQKTRTFVYQGGDILAWQQKVGSTENITWEHRDASNATLKLPGVWEGESGAEFEPQGGNAGMHPPLAFPGPEQPSLSETRSYPALAEMLGGRCSADGVTVPCEFANSLRQHGAGVECPNNNCGPRTMIVTNLEGETRSFLSTPFMAFTNGVSGYFWPGWVGMGSAAEQAKAIFDASRGGNPTGMDSPRGQFTNNLIPQNPAPDVNDLRNRIAKITSNPDCANFIKDLISKTATDENPAEFTDALKGFEKIANQRGFIYGDTIRKKYGFDASTVNGTISGPSGAQVELARPYLNVRTPAIIESQLRIQAMSALHEILHLAGKKQAYSDREYANAVAAMPGAKPLPDFSNMTYIDAVRGASDYWNKALYAVCKPKD